MPRQRNIVVLNETYQKIAQEFYQHRQKVGYAASSSRNSYWSVLDFFHWLEQQGQPSIKEVKAPQINQYYEYLSHRPNRITGGVLNLKTTHRQMQNIRDMFSLLQANHQIQQHPCTTLHFPYPKDYKQRTILSQSEIEQLYEVCETNQERAILSLAYGCGLRAGALEKCDIKDVRLREKIVVVPKSKGGKRRIIPLSKGVVKDLSNYYYKERESLTKGRDHRPNDPAFMLNSRGGRMQQWTYNKYLKRIIDRTENEELKKKEISLHCLRHSIATHLLERGISVHQVRLFLGHNQLETTQIYTHISKEQLQKLSKNIIE